MTNRKKIFIRRICGVLGVLLLALSDGQAIAQSRVHISQISQLSDGDTLYFGGGERHFYADKAEKDSLYLSNTTDILPKNLAIVLRDKKNIVIDGQGAMLIMHGPIQPLTLIDCQNIEIKNLRVDWLYPLTAEGRIEKVTDKGFYVKIDASQFPYLIEDKKLVFAAEGWRSPIFSVMEFTPYDQDSIARIAPNTGDVTSWQCATYPVSKAPKGRIFFAADTSKYRPAVGNYVVLRHNERAHAGVFVEKSKDIRFDNVWIHHTGGLGVLCQYTENIEFHNSGVVPNPDKGRYLSGHDDGFHLMGCRGKIKVENCRWQGLMDDPMNIHGTSVRIVEIKDEHTILCRFIHHQSVGMEWGQVGNEVAFLESKTLRTIDEAKIERYEKLSTTDFLITLDKRISTNVQVGDALENRHWAPSYVTIRGNKFGGNRARGLLVSVSGKVIVENNDFYSSGSAILIAGDANNWYETGAVRDVTIRGNRFYNCNTSYYQFCRAVISIFPEVAVADPKYPFHRGITIEDNTFYSPKKLSEQDILYIYSAEDVVFRNNRIEQTH